MRNFRWLDSSVNIYPHNYHEHGFNTHIPQRSNVRHVRSWIVAPFNSLILITNVMFTAYIHQIWRTFIWRQPRPRCIFTVCKLISPPLQWLCGISLANGGATYVEHSKPHKHTHTHVQCGRCIFYNNMFCGQHFSSLRVSAHKIPRKIGRNLANVGLLNICVQSMAWSACAFDFIIFIYFYIKHLYLNFVEYVE